MRAYKNAGVGFKVGFLVQVFVYRHTGRALSMGIAHKSGTECLLSAC